MYLNWIVDFYRKCLHGKFQRKKGFKQFTVCVCVGRGGALHVLINLIYYDKQGRQTASSARLVERHSGAEGIGKEGLKSVIQC